MNTHIDFSNSSYSNLSVVENAINYLGIKNLRDSANSSKDLGATGLWQQVANATGAKFDAFLAEGSVATMQADLANAVTLSKQGILNFIEGGNEEDQSYATSLGNSLAQTAAYQKQVYTTAHALGIPVINMSFGTGWSKATGDYGTVGNLAGYSDYANAHTYFGTGNTPLSTINILNSDANLAATGKPVITTEMGWYTTGSTTDVNNVSTSEQAKYMLDGLLDAYQAGDVKTYLYELLDQHAGSTYTEYNFGLFNADGTPKAAATALHNLTALLADTGSTASTFTATGLSYGLTGTISTDHSMLMQKSDGTFWLSVWNEARLSGPTSPAAITVANHTVTLSLGSAAATIKVFDPLTGTSATQTIANASSVTLSVPDHPVLVEIIPGSGTSSGSTGSGGSGGSGGSSGSGGTPTVNDLAITAPSAAATVYTAQTGSVTGVSISDAWAANHAGSMALSLTALHGTIEISNGTGMVSATAGQPLNLSGSLAQLNADLATLKYVAGSSVGSDSISVSVYNQGGVSAAKSVGISMIAAPVAVSANDLAVALPSAAPTITHNVMTSVPGISISDAWAANHAGSMALSLSVGHGTLEVSNGVSMVTGASMTLTGSLAQLNADLATLHYDATASGTDSLSVSVYNQGGVSVAHALGLHII